MNLGFQMTWLIQSELQSLKLKIHSVLHLIKLIYLFVYAITTWVVELPAQSCALLAFRIVACRRPCHWKASLLLPGTVGSTPAIPALGGRTVGAGLPASLGCRVSESLCETQMSNYAANMHNMQAKPSVDFLY